MQRKQPSTQSAFCLAQVSGELRDLIRRMLEVDVARRITIAEVARHPWVAADMPPELSSLNGRLAAVRAASGGGGCDGGAWPPPPPHPGFSQGAGELRALVRQAAAPVGAQGQLVSGGGRSSQRRASGACSRDPAGAAAPLSSSCPCH